MDLTKWLQAQWDRVAAWACVTAGVAVLIIGWVGVSGTEYPAAQLPYIISGGVGGIFLLGLGAMLWLSADLRDEWRKLDRIDEHLARGALSDRAPTPAVHAHVESTGEMNGPESHRRYASRASLEPSPDVLAEPPVRSKTAVASPRSASVQAGVDEGRSRTGTAVRRAAGGRSGGSSDGQGDQ